MTDLTAWLSSLSTVTCGVLFAGIVWWACSSGRRVLNEQAARLPFALPDEFNTCNKESS
jgi:cytochrome c oxidase cbb3-type subunit 4